MGGFNGSGYKALANFLSNIANNEGYMMHFNGNTRSSKNPFREFRCLHGKKYQGDIPERSVKVYRYFSMHNDRKMINCDKKGRQMCRRRIVTRPIFRHKLCQYKLIIQFDEVGFYVKPGQGHRTHDGHPVLQETGFIHTSKAISLEDKAMCLKIKKSHAPVASAITLLTNATKTNFNYHQVRYICSFG